MARLLLLFCICLSICTYGIDDVAINHVEHNSSATINEEISITGWIYNNGDNPVIVEGLNVNIDTITSGNNTSLAAEFTIDFNQQYTILPGDSLYFDDLLDVNETFFHAGYTDIVIVWPIIDNGDFEDENPENNYHTSYLTVYDLATGIQNNTTTITQLDNQIAINSSHSNLRTNIFDINGQLVLNHKKRHFNTSELPEGIYFIQVISHNQVILLNKIYIQH